ncbi:P-loop containing nucleoside triphosphate hydrolase protein [Meredithblackwellia eburnea MCA 4105]
MALPPALVLLVLAILVASYLVYEARTNPDPSLKRKLKPPNREDVTRTGNGAHSSSPLSDEDEEDDADEKVRDQEIDPESFYPKLRAKKIWQVVVLVTLLAVELFGLGWKTVGGGKGTWEDGVMMCAYWGLSLWIAALSFPLTNSKFDVDRHWTYTVCLTILTLAAFISTLLRLVLPTSASIAPSPDDPRFIFVTDITLTTLVTIFQFIAFLLAGTTERCAPLGKRMDASRPTGEEENADTESHKPQYIPISSLRSASTISYILFGWLSPVLKTGSNVESLAEEDLPILGLQDQAETRWKRITETTDDDGPKWVNRLLWRVFKSNKNLFYWQTVLAFITAFLYYLPAFFLQRLIAFLENRPISAPGEPAPSLAWGYVYCLGLLSAALLDAVISGQLWFVSNSMLATRIRVELNCLVFDKTLKRKDVAGVGSGNKQDGDDKSSDDEESDKGLFDFGEANVEFSSKSQVLNLFTIDVDRVADFAIWCFSFVDAPMEILIGTYFLYQLLGYAAFVGISVAILFLPLNHITSKAFANVQDRLMSARDKRVSLMNEVLQSVRMIKYMATEKPFEERIMASRAEELKHLRTNFMLEVSFNAIWSVSPILCVLVSFYVFTMVMGRDLTPSIAFASLAVWNELRFALNVIPDILVNAIQCLVSLRRLQSYLDTPEVDIRQSESQLPEEPEPTLIALQSASATWPTPTTGKEEEEEIPLGAQTPAKSFELQDLSLRFPVGDMSLVCGALGSGKTLLLLTLLGEADVLAGQVVCPRSSPDAIALPNIEWDSILTEDNWVQPNRTAFVPQSAWLQNASVRNNILFGLPFRKHRYQATLEACSLVTDLAILEDGDETEIGEKGINLSGGQKARVSLARAVYSRASILLLDDVLSAVDAHTSLHIFNNCLKGPLMAGRTIILVSHHIQLTAPGTSYVVELENGRVKFEGDSKEFLSSPRFKTEKEEEEPIEDKVAVVKSPPKLKNKALDLVTESTFVSETSSASEAESDSDEEEAEEEVKKEKPARKLIEDEARAVGRVSLSVWTLYLGLSGGIFYWISFVLTFGGVKVADVAQTFWLNLWSASYTEQRDGVGRSVTYYLAVYSLLSLLAVAVGTLQWFVLYVGSLRASDKLYRILLHAILRAPLRFFDTQALGRLLNRFGKDFEGVDAALPDHWGRSILYGLGVLTTLTVIASVAPLFLVGFAILSVAYFHHAALYSKTSRELRRLDSVTKSPLYSIYGEAIAGVSVIRAFGSSARFMKLMLTRCSTNVTFYWYLWSVNRWLSIRFALLSAVVLALTGYVLLQAGDKVDAALAGFALTFSLNIANDILFLVRRYTALELAMVGVERIKEYSEVEQEAPEVIEPRPPAVWPHLGEIHVEKLTIRYAPELPNVLHELDFAVAPGQKVGIVGATGCGKSTLALSFFRFVEAWSGKIVIDGLDISKVGLKDLRSRLTIIPQDPTILSGTLRSTLDIFGEHDDAEIFSALRRVHLIKPDEDLSQDPEDGANRSPFHDLDWEVSEGGANFSQGQRQLLCMARALLKRNRLLLLDEATASVDYETDEMITRSIREEFADSTLLVIAHRLRTVIAFDRILVLDAGRILEYDHPAKLLENPASRFYALCRATGKSEFRILKKMAEGKTRATHKPRKLIRRSSTKPSLP